MVDYVIETNNLSKKFKEMEDTVKEKWAPLKKLNFIPLDTNWNAWFLFLYTDNLEHF